MIKTTSSIFKKLEAELAAKDFPNNWVICLLCKEVVRLIHICPIKVYRSIRKPLAPKTKIKPSGKKYKRGHKAYWDYMKENL